MSPIVPPEQKEIHTPRLLLRGAKPEDAEGLFKAFTDPEVMKYWSSLPHDIPKQTRTWVSNMIKSPQNGTTDFVITLSSSRTAIGKIGIWQDSEIGFMIAREHWRKGFVSEALKALLPYYFEEVLYKRIIADVDPRNEASIAILENFGFGIVGTRERTFEIGGVWVDSVDLELSREEWMRLEGA